MNPPNNDTAPQGLREWWLTPPRSGTQRLINPLEYRHLRLFGALRVAGGGVAVAAAVACFAYSAYGWGVFFLVLGTLNLAGGSWYVTIGRSAVTQRSERPSQPKRTDGAV